MAEMTAQANVISCKLLQECTRPGVSSGLWLTGLLPIALLINAVRQAVGVDYWSITFLSWMILVNQFLILWKLWSLNGRNEVHFVIALIATGIGTTLITSLVIGQSLIIGAFSGFIVTFAVQWIFCGLLQQLPKSFTIGEAAVVGQGLLLFLFKSLALDLPRAVLSLSRLEEYPDDDLQSVVHILEIGVLLIFLLIFLMKIFGQIVQNFFIFSGLLGLIILGILVNPVTKPIPILFVRDLIINDPEKIAVIGVFGLFILATFAFCYWHTSSQRPTSTITRKSFHVAIVFVFLVGILYQRLVLFLCAGVAFALFLLSEAIRVGKVQYLSDVLEHTVKSFVDNQDAGIIALTPIYLLVGCAAPLFLSPVAFNKDTLLPLLSGVLAVGVGDSFAGFVGSIYGRHLWEGTKKSKEGTVANIISQFLFIGGLMATGYLPVWSTSWEYVVCIVGVVTNAIVEAKTDQVDNLIVPLVTFAIFSLI